MKLSATVKEAVADVQVEISQEEDSEAGSGAPRPRTRQNGRPEQPDVCQRPADVRARDSRVRHLVLFGASLAFNRTVVLRYRIHLEQRGYAPATMHVAEGAVGCGPRRGGSRREHHIETSTRQTHERSAPVASTPQDCGAERRIVAPITRTRFQGYRHESSPNDESVPGAGRCRDRRGARDAG